MPAAWKDIPINPGSQVPVGTADTPVVAANTLREEITLTNDSANTIYLRFAATGAASMAVGVRLNANGGNWTSSKYRGAISAYASSAGSALLVYEL